MKIEVDISKVTKVLGKIASNTDNVQPLLKRIALFELKKVGETFANEGDRDEHEKWKPFANQYTRKTDNVTIPAWGGVTKLKTKGRVKGRKRPSGKRITATSKLLQDTGTLRSSFKIILLENKKVIFGSMLNYAPKHQFGLDKTPKREMIFITINDEENIQTILNDYVVGQILKA